MKTLRILAATIVLAAVALATLWFCRIPFLDWDSVAFAAQSGFTRVEVDPQIEWMIRRARLDFLITPPPTGGDLIKFMFAKLDSTTLYLFFRPGWSHNAVVYAYDRSTRKALWKTQVDTDPDR